MSTVYSCPHLGCDFVIGAVGPQDPDEPDYFTEDVEAHKRSHADDDGTESEAIAEVQVPHPGEIDEGPLVRSSSQAGLATSAHVDMTDADWSAMADAYGPVCAACEGDDDASHVVGCLWIAKRREAVPSLVELDRRDVTDRVLGAALEWEYAISAVAPPPVAMRPAVAAQALLAAVRDYRAVIGR